MPILSPTNVPLCVNFPIHFSIGVENVHVLFAELKTNLKRGESAGIANSLYMEKSVLWLACFHQRYEIAEILLQNGAEVNFSAWVPTQIQFSDLKDAMSKRRDNKVGENITAIDGCGEFLNENYPSSEIVDTNNSKMRKGINDNVEVLQSCLDVCLERQQYPITALLLRFQKDVKLAPLNSVIMDEQVLHRYMQLQQLSDMVKVAIRGKQYDRVFVIVCFETVKEGECWLHTNVKKRNANTASNKGSRKPILEVSEWCHECIRVSKRFQSSSATVIPKHLYILDEYAHCRAHLVVNFPDTMGKTALFHLASRSGGILDGTVVEKAEQSMSAFCPSEGPAGDNVSIFWKDSNKRMWMSDEEKRLARFLLHSGGNPFKLDRMGMTVVDTCLNRSNVDFLTILLQHDIDISISRCVNAVLY